MIIWRAAMYQEKKKKQQHWQVRSKMPIGCCIKQEHNKEFQLTLLKAERSAADLLPSSLKTQLLCKQRTYKSASSTQKKTFRLTCAAHDAIGPDYLEYINFKRYMVPQGLCAHHCLVIFCLLPSQTICGNKACFQSTDPTIRNEKKYGFVGKKIRSDVCYNTIYLPTGEQKLALMS